MTTLRWLPLAIVLQALPTAASAWTEEDRVECRAANPGPSAEVANAVLACMQGRQQARQEEEAKRKAEEWRKLEAALPTFNLEQAREACARDVRACARQDELQSAARAEAEVRWQAERAARIAEEERLMAEAAEEARVEAEKEAALQKKCGKDFGRVRVGMKWSRVKVCSGPGALVAEDTGGAVYEVPGGLVRVQGGQVVRWVAR